MDVSISHGNRIMRGTGIGNLRISPSARIEPAPGGRRTAQRDTPAPRSGLPVPLTPSPARNPQRPARTGPSAPFLAQVIAQARPGLSPAREARRRPAPALDAYRAARALKSGGPIASVGRRLDLAGV
jgi:hypothetical protein